MNPVELSFRADTSLPKLLAAAASVQAKTGFTMIRVPKRGGGGRLVHKASPAVDAQQSAIKMVLNDVYEPFPCVHGYVTGRGTYTNALPHLAQPVILRVDLHAFFSTVTRAHLEQCLQQLFFDRASTNLVLDLSCVDDCLAAGFSTGPVLSNIAFSQTDTELIRLAEVRSLNYTRYADDLTFSGSDICDKTLDEVRKVLEANSWTVNDRKTRFMRAGGPQFVTGLYVGLPDRPRIPSRMKRRFRQQLHYLSIYGYNDCHARVPWTMGQRRARGWLNYISHVEPELGSELREVLQKVDFDLPRRIGFDDEWDAWLDEFGVPEDL